MESDKITGIEQGDVSTDSKYTCKQQPLLTLSGVYLMYDVCVVKLIVMLQVG